MEVARVLAVLAPGGAQLNVLRTSAVLRRRGVDVRLLVGEATEEGLDLAIDAGVPVEVWGGGTGLQYACSEEFSAWLRPRLASADLVHGQMFGGWWAASRALPDGVPLVASEHNALQWPGPARVDLYADALASVDLFYAASPPVAALVRRLGLPARRMGTARSCIEPIGDERPLEDLPEPRIVFAGRLHPEKGPDLLVRAVGALSDPPATFVLGAGPMERELHELVSAHGLEDRVKFLGWQHAVVPWITGAAACVVPSRHEAWSQTAVLALALGVPVIGTAVEGLPGTLGHGRGVLVAPESPDRLARAIADVLAGDRPAASPGRDYAAQFTPESVADALLDDYCGLLASERTLAA